LPFLSVHGPSGKGLGSDGAGAAAGAAGAPAVAAASTGAAWAAAGAAAAAAALAGGGVGPGAGSGGTAAAGAGGSAGPAREAAGAATAAAAGGGAANWAGEYHVGAWWTGGGDLTSQDELAGVYLSAAWEIFRESDDPGDEQGLGLFTRWGWVDGEAAELDCFWSVGLQYRGLIELRDDDVLGIAFARGTFAGSDRPAGLGGSEQVVELYYSIAVASWLSLSPDVQYIADPGGRSGSADAFVVGLRARILIE